MLRSRSYSVKPETDLRGGRFTGRVSAYPAGSLPHGILACTVCLRWTPPRDPHCYPIRCLRNQGKSRMTRGTFRIWWRRPSWKDSIKYTLRFADQSRKDDGAAVEPQVARRKRNNPPSLSAHVYSHQTTTVRERSRCVGDRCAQDQIIAKSEPKQVEYWRGYREGIRFHFQDNTWASYRDHDHLHKIADRIDGDSPVVAYARGYCDGCRGKKPEDSP
jgi:hypothetical protein